MSDPANRMLEQVLTLPPAERAELAARILASLDGADEKDWTAFWEQEIARREHELDSGTVKPLSHDEAFQAMFGADHAGETG